MAFGNRFTLGYANLLPGRSIIAIITWMVRRLMKVRSQNRYLGWVSADYGHLGWISLAYLSPLWRDWSTTNSAEQQIAYLNRH
jgi:hypothetical protein